MSIRCDNSIAVRWYGLNALEFRHRNGSFMIDPYVSRSPEKITIPEEVEKYLVSRPDFVLMTHSHWDHLPDMPLLIRRTGTVLYASRTACNIMRSLGVAEKKSARTLLWRTSRTSRGRPGHRAGVTSHG